MNEDARATTADPADDRLAELFETQVKPLVFAGHRPSAAPRLVLVGAQPGAGKSHAIAGIEHETRDADLVVLTGDALRPLHPDYAALLRADPLSMPNATSPIVAAWVRKCIDHALAARHSLLLEGTFRDLDAVAATVRRFADAGYQTQAVVLAVRPERSRLDTLRRYMVAGVGARWTPPTAHDTALARLPHTVDGLQDVDQLHRIEVHTRDRTVFSDQRGADGRWQQPQRAFDALIAEHDRPFDAGQSGEWLGQFEQVIDVAETLPTIEARALPTFVALIGDADRIAATAVDPDRTRLAKLQHRAAALVQRHDPEWDATRPFGTRAQVFPPLVVDPDAMHDQPELGPSQQPSNRHSRR